MMTLPAGPALEQQLWQLGGTSFLTDKVSMTEAKNLPYLVPYVLKIKSIFNINVKVIS
jgi:hypothetical protein